MGFHKQLIEFISQAKTDNLKTKHFNSKFLNTKVKVSFGQGNAARIPWISFLIEPNKTSDGIYPVYLYYKDYDLLILAYGISETNVPIQDWNINNGQTIKEYFEVNFNQKPDRYGSSFIYKVYDLNEELNENIIDKDIENIIHEYSAIQIPSKQKSNNTFTQNTFEIQEFNIACKNSGLTYSDQLITRFTASLTTKPFVLLTGLSGSGKTKLAQSFAQWISESKEQYCIIPVGADWTNREPLLGYVNALDDTQYISPENGALTLILNANNNAHKPYFLILDEMNLSHVERYFADFLSVMESNAKFKLHNDSTLHKSGIPHELSWPQNLFVIGTVNIDETTYMFSPKVLDRANVIEFRVDEHEIAKFLKESKKITSIEGFGKTMGDSFVNIAKGNPTHVDLSNLNDELLNFFADLKKLGAEFGYRTGSEIQSLFSKIDLIDPSFIQKEDDKIDIAIMQKLLPKLHGSRRKLIGTLEVLAKKCLLTSTENIFNEKGESLIVSSNIKYKLSFEKLSRMYKDLIDNGFTSYAEA